MLCSVLQEMLESSSLSSGELRLLLVAQLPAGCLTCVLLAVIQEVTGICILHCYRADNNMYMAITYAILMDMYNHLSEKDKPYFRESREKLFKGQKLEDVSLYLFNMPCEYKLLKPTPVKVYAVHFI